MFIIADSGSTKCDWTSVFADGSTSTITTTGLNPFFHDTDFMEKTLISELLPKLNAADVSKVAFYGAGVHDAARAAVVEQALRKIFPAKTNITVEHDLLAAARSACGDSAGIVAIIGTGSNTCLYDGTKVVDNVPNLGFLAGDEGSGSHIGKKLIQAYFYRELPDEILRDFETQYSEGMTAIKNNIYTGSGNVYLASFTRFLAAHKSNFFVQRLVAGAFDELIDRHILKYKGNNELPIHFVGSVAHYFQDILRTCLKIRGLHTGTIIQRPIDALVDYHLTHQ
jgi:N-acetylglucosamine kinase-like BadF-type ATPase